MLFTCGGQQVSCLHRAAINSFQHMQAWLGLQDAVLRWINLPCLPGCLNPQTQRHSEQAAARSAEPTCMSEGCGLTLCTQDSARTTCQQGRCAMRAGCACQLAWCLVFASLPPASFRAWTRA